MRVNWSKLKRSIKWNNTAVLIKKPENVFLVFSIFFGIIFVFLLPPFQAPDEQSHFFKAYQLSNLQIGPTKFNNGKDTRYGAAIPRSVEHAVYDLKTNISGQPTLEYDTSLYGKYLYQRINYNDTVNVAFEGAAVYSPVAYIPQAIGITIGKFFQSSPLTLMWMGRIANLVVWITLSYLAIRILPFAKWGMVVLLLNPMVLFLAASLSADPVIIGLSCVFISTTAVAISQKPPVSKKMEYALIGLLAALTLTKPIYIIFGLALLTIPYRKLGNLKRYVIFIILAGITSIGVAALWNLFVVRDVIEAVGALQRPGSGVSTSGQLSYLLHNMPAYFIDLIRNYILVTPGFYGNEVLYTYFGVFGWLDSRLPLWTVILYIVTLTVAILYQFGRGAVMNFWQKTTFVVTAGGLFAATITALYLNYTPVGQSLVEGVQGRYFIPMSLVLLVLFLGKKKFLLISQKGMGVFTTASLTTVYIMTTAILYLRYYW